MSETLNNLVKNSSFVPTNWFYFILFFLKKKELRARAKLTILWNLSKAEDHSATWQPRKSERCTASAVHNAGSTSQVWCGELTQNKPRCGTSNSDTDGNWSRHTRTLISEIFINWFPAFGFRVLTKQSVRHLHHVRTSLHSLGHIEYETLYLMLPRCETLLTAPE